MLIYIYLNVLGEKMRNKASIAVFIMLSFSVVVLFQNCGVEVPESMFDQSLGSNEIYKLQVNQLAYMSCAEQSNVANEPNVLFTFRAGAYGTTGGLRLTDDFVTLNRLKSDVSVRNTLEEDVVTGGSQVQFALRKQGDLSQMYVNGTGSTDGVDGYDYDFTFGTLGSEEMTAALLTTNSERNGWLNYWAAGGVTADAYFEGSVIFNDSEENAQRVRTFLTTGGGILSSLLASPSEPATVVTPNYSYDDDKDNDDNTVPGNVGMGVGLKISFKQPTLSTWGYDDPGSSVYSAVPKRVLASVTEYNLASPTAATGNWTCPANLQFRIVDHADINLNDASGVGTLCSEAADPAVLSADLQRVRNSLPASDWYVDMTRKCVVPKRYAVGTCYGIKANTNIRRAVNYNFTTACNPAVVDSVNVCSHFISICYKNQ